jgi:restriction endonuclease Mrr
MQITEFVVDQHYNNQDIYRTLGIQNVGGIRPKIADGILQFIVLTTSTADVNISFARNPYADRIEEDLLVYTAAGLAGDQALAGVNKRIIEQYERPIPIFGFINEGSSQGRRFLGLLELLRHYQETQLDAKRNLRQAWIFEFKIYRSPSVVPLQIAGQISEQIISESRKKSDEERGEVRLADADNELSQLKETRSADYALLESFRTKLLLVNPYAFEELVRDTVERNGFHKVSVTKRSGDGGIDVNGYLGPSYYFAYDILVQFQAKRWKHSVGRKEIAQLRGSLEAPFGVMITTSHFTVQAIQESKETTQKPIVLIDGIRFAEIISLLKVPTEKYLANANTGKEL